MESSRLINPFFEELTASFDWRALLTMSVFFSLSARRHTLFQLLEPVEDDNHAGRRHILPMMSLPSGVMETPSAGGDADGREH